MKSSPTAARVRRTISTGKRRRFSGVRSPRVVALVGARRQELIEQIALAAHDLHAVVACLAGQQCTPGEVVDRAVDVAQRPRPERVDRRLDGRCTDRKRVVRIASGVQDLQQDLAVGLVHRAGDPAVPSSLRRRRHLRGEGQQPARSVRGVPAGDDQADAAAGAFGEVLGEPVGVAGAVLEAGVHGTHHHAVAQRGEAEVQRRQQVRVRHGAPFRAVATSSSQSMALSSARMPPRSTRY